MGGLLAALALGLRPEAERLTRFLEVLFGHTACCP